MVHAENVYKFHRVSIDGRLCRTNIASNTAFRGFGGPQSMFAVEYALKHLAEEHGLDVDELRERNLYQDEGECTPFGMQLHQCNIRRCWRELLELADYQQRKGLVREFNSKSVHRKRGIYVVPTKFGIAFAVKNSMNQAGALVNIYTDGSVLVHHAGIEMGQGLNTKVLQVEWREGF